MNAYLNNSQELLMPLDMFDKSSMQMFSPLTLQQLGHMLPDAMVAVDRKGTICAWNEAAVALFGYSVDAAMGAELFTLFPQLLLVQGGVWKSLVREKSLQGVCVELPHRDGYAIRVEISISLLSLDGSTIGDSTIGDSTIGDSTIGGGLLVCRKHRLEPPLTTAQRHFQNQQQWLESVLGQMQEAIMCTDHEHRITYVNPAWEQLNGYTLVEVQDAPARILTSGKTPSVFFEKMLQTLSAGQIFYGEVWNRRKDGSLYEGALSVLPLTDTEENITGYFSLIRSLSDEKLLLRAQERFVSDLSHELRTPLTNIKFYLSLLEKGRKERHAVYMSTLKREADRLHYMIEGMLDLSRMDQDHAWYQFDALSLNAILHAFIQQYMSTAQAKNITLTFEPDETLPHVWGDIKYLEQVVFHLLENSIRYTPEGGSVIVSTFIDVEDSIDGASAGDSAGDAGFEEVAAALEMGRDGDTVDTFFGMPYLCFSVQDSGTGIAAHEMNRVFERFYRGQNAQQLSVPGAGLGLAVSKEVVARHGGRIDVSSQVGQGSTFTVYLRPAPEDADGDH